MNQSEFEKLSSDLRTLVKKIPLNWGAVQNDRFDSNVDIFKIQTYEQLEDAVAPLNETVQNYLRRRWFIWRCSECDEYLFYKNPNVVQNPDRYDKSYDVEFNDDAHYRFDVKGTVIPKGFRDNIDSILANPQPMIDFFYEKQSKGVRFGMQNRLFVVHHSFVNSQRELYLRCAWKSKEAIYAEYSDKVATKNFFSYKGYKSDVIFILEREKNKVEHIIF